MPSLVATLRDISLHAAAWGLLRAYPPARAHEILLRAGARFAPIHTPEEARRVSRAVGRFGTCLSRALAVAARMPTAEVVIGVAPRRNAPLFAHAWVEVDGAPIDPDEVAGNVIARLRSPDSTRRAHAAL